MSNNQQVLIPLSVASSSPNPAPQNNNNEGSSNVHWFSNANSNNGGSTTQTPEELKKAEKWRNTKKYLNFFGFLFVIFTSLFAGLQLGGLLDGQGLVLVDAIFLAVLILEVLFRMYVYRFPKYFWDINHTIPIQVGNVADVVITIVAIVFVCVYREPGKGTTILIYRIFRFLHVMPGMRRLLMGLRNSILQIMIVFFQMFFIIYLFALLGVMYFRDIPTDNQTFKSIPWAMFTMFEVLTMQWSDTCRQIMVVRPEAAVFFILYIMIAGWFILLLLTAIIVDAVRNSTPKDGDLFKFLTRKKDELQQKIAQAKIQEQLSRSIGKLGALASSPSKTNVTKQLTHPQLAEAQQPAPSQSPQNNPSSTSPQPQPHPQPQPQPTPPKTSSNKDKDKAAAVTATPSSGTSEGVRSEDGEKLLKELSKIRSTLENEISDLRRMIKQLDEAAEEEAI